MFIGQMVVSIWPDYFNEVFRVSNDEMLVVHKKIGGFHVEHNSTRKTGKEPASSS